jgi:hypothetical protein
VSQQRASFIFVSTSVAQAPGENFDTAPAPGENYDAAPADPAPAPTLLHSKPKFLKRTKV